MVSTKVLISSDMITYDSQMKCDLALLWMKLTLVMWKGNNNETSNFLFSIIRFPAQPNMQKFQFFYVPMTKMTMDTWD